MKLLIGIPAFNESEMIGKVITSLPKKLKGMEKTDILVVDDGSIDGTSAIAEKKGVLVLTHLLNRGLGGALKTIFTYARGKNYDLLVTFDADGQHDGKDIENLVKPIIANRKDVVIGTRWKNSKNVAFARRFVNHFANWLTLLLFGISTTDSQSGLRAFNRQAIKNINITSDGMEASSEFFKEIKKNNLRFGEVGIEPIYTKYSLKKGQKLDNAPEVFFRLLLRFIR